MLRILGTRSLKEEIDDDSRIYHDLKIRGTDAVEVLNQLFKIFAVDFTGFDFARYFKGEYYSPVDLFNDVFRREDKTKAAFTVGHLIAVCEAGKWRDPETPSMQSAGMRDRVIAFAARQTGLVPDFMGAQTSLGDGLGVDGHDAEEFIAAFSKEFGVDMRSFPFANYFGPEAGATPFTPLLYVFRRKSPEVRIGGLAASADVGRWKPPE